MAQGNYEFNENELCVCIREICPAPMIVLGQYPEEAAGIDFLEVGLMFI